MNNELLWGSLIGFLCGVFGTGLGAALSFSIRKDDIRIVSFIMELAAGLMVGVVAFELLPEAFELSGLLIGITGLAVGAVIAMLAQEYIHSKQAICENESAVTGFMVAAGIALHNFPEGLAIGSGLGSSVKLGLTLAIVIALHNIPEGMAIGLPLKHGGYSPMRTLLAAFTAGLPMAAGALIGCFLGDISLHIVGFCLALAGGAMMYIVNGDMVPHSYTLYRGRMPAAGHIIGFAVGAMISVGI